MNETERMRTTHTQELHTHNQKVPQRQKKMCVKILLLLQREIKNKSIRVLQTQIKNVIGYELTETKIKKLLVRATLEHIQYHLDQWNIHKQNQVKPGAGYFITVVENDVVPLVRRWCINQLHKIFKNHTVTSW